jgi:hypothetical protein
MKISKTSILNSKSHPNSNLTSPTSRIKDSSRWCKCPLSLPLWLLLLMKSLRWVMLRILKASTQAFTALATNNLFSATKLATERQYLQSTELLWNNSTCSSSNSCSSLISTQWCAIVLKMRSKSCCNSIQSEWRPSRDRVLLALI